MVVSILKDNQFYSIEFNTTIPLRHEENPVDAISQSKVDVDGKLQLQVEKGKSDIVFLNVLYMGASVIQEPLAFKRDASEDEMVKVCMTKYSYNDYQAEQADFLASQSSFGPYGLRQGWARVVSKS